MIQSKQQMQQYIQQDRLMNAGYTHKGIKRAIKELLIPNPILLYLLFLRKAEYYTNVKPVGGAIIGAYYKYKLRKWGRKLGFSIPINVCGPGLSLPHYGTIVINGKASIGENCRIHTSVNIGASGGSKAAPRIGNNVYIAPGAILFGDIEIGNNITIGANATVNHSCLDENVVLGGTPAKVLKKDMPNWLQFNKINSINEKNTK